MVSASIFFREAFVMPSVWRVLDVMLYQTIIFTSLASTVAHTTVAYA